MKLSHSRIETYTKCPRQFKYRYIDELTTLPTDDPANPLILGHALHTGIEKDVEAAIQEYYSAYPIINDSHVTEAMKLEYLIPKIKKLLPVGEHEVKIENQGFLGFIDLLVPIDSNTYDLYDFKYSNNISSYLESGQLHEYKFYFEKLNPGKKIRKLYFVFIPKSQLRIKYKNKTNPRDETIYEFRNRTMEDLKSKEITIQEVQYDPNKVTEFLSNAKKALEDTEYKKNETNLCMWCEFNEYCLEGIDYEIIKKEEN